jgi:hypothetical protein
MGPLGLFVAIFFINFTTFSIRHFHIMPEGSSPASRAADFGPTPTSGPIGSVDRGNPCCCSFGAMADVFISYAKADRPLALKLAAMLEAEGWTTWWDTSLTIGDDFRNEIMTELGRARAVIVIWTDTSIKSDWVRSEAGRAQADRKLIPVKLPHLEYEDLPPPFDVLHTEDIGQEDKIRAAVVAQLAKPAVEPSTWALLAKGFKYELLTWVGIVGGALTLFTNLGAVLKLADWARVLVEHWKEWTHAFWVWVFGWVGIRLSPDWTPVLSFLLFGLLLTIGQAIQFGHASKTQSIIDKSKSFQLSSWRMFFCLALCLLPASLNVLLLADWLPVEEVYSLPELIAFWFPVIAVITFARHRLYAAAVVSLMMMFWMIITHNQLLQIGLFDDLTAYLTAFAMWGVFPLVLLSVAPAKNVARRLIFLALGLLLLIGLNELSKLGLDLTAPKFQG